MQSDSDPPIRQPWYASPEGNDRMLKCQDNLKIITSGKKNAKRHSYHPQFPLVLKMFRLLWIGDFDREWMVYIGLAITLGVWINVNIIVLSVRSPFYIKFARN